MKSVTKKKLKGARCGRRFSRLRKGRPARYCSPSCRQRAYEARKNEREVSARLPVRLLEEDFDGVRTRDALKRAVISVLEELDIILPSSQEPIPHRARPRLVMSGRDEDKGDPPPTSD